MSFDRHCAEIVAQTELLTGYIAGADLSRPVPTCPGWNVSQLLRHIDGGLQWAAEIVATRVTSPTAGRGAARPGRLPGRTIGLHATDTGADWLLDLTGDVIAWRRSDEPTTAAMCGPVTDLLLTIYRRIPVESGRIELTGDAELVDFWLERVGFG